MRRWGERRARGSLGALLALAAFFAACASADSPGRPNRTVTISNGRILEPQVLEVQPGDLVIWVNNAPGGEVQIAFPRGEAAPDVGGSISSPTARFDRPGRFPYVATARTKIGGPFGVVEVVLQGAIVVQAPAVADAPAARPPAPAAPPVAPPAPAPAAPAPPTPGPGPSEPDVAPSSPDVARVRGGREAAAALRWAPSQGLAARIERSAATPARLRPGESLALEIDWTIVIPSGAGLARVRQAWVILREGETLTRLERETDVGSGTYRIRRSLPLPGDLLPGRYTVSSEVEATAGGNTARDRASGGFVVVP